MNATDSDNSSDDDRNTMCCTPLAIRYRRILC